MCLLTRNNPRKVLWVVSNSLFSKKFERMTREAMDICLRVLKESTKSRFDSYSVRKCALMISHVTFRDCRLHIFSDNFSRNSCICVEFNPFSPNSAQRSIFS